MRSIVVIGVCLAALGACQVATLPQGADEQDAPSSGLFRPAPLTVMTRSLDPGLSLERALALRGEPGPARASELMAALRAEDTRFRVRMLAEEIQSARPHLIGLQQAVQVGLRHPGEPAVESPEARAVELLPLLLGELESRGLHYREVARVGNTDVELPLLIHPDGPLDTLRLTDFDVILAREDVAVEGVRTGHYRAHRELTQPGHSPVQLVRGWASVAAAVEGQRYRFVSTHLEPAPAEDALRVQRAQASELIDSLRGEPLPVVLVGDFNTPANLGLVGAPTYGELLLAGYVDVWTRRQGGEEVAEETSGEVRRGAREERRHLVLVRNPVAPNPRRVGPVLAYALGSAPPAPGLGPWSAERAGVVAHLSLPGPLRN